MKMLKIWFEAETLWDGTYEDLQKIEEDFMKFKEELSKKPRYGRFTYRSKPFEKW